LRRKRGRVEMPLMSGKMMGFGVEMTTTHGRAMIERQRYLHVDMVGRAPTVVEDRVLPIYMRQMKILHEAERFKPSFNQMKARQEEDSVMTNLLRDARPTSSHRLDMRTVNFRELRRNHPNFTDSALVKHDATRNMEVHNDIIKQSKKWIDDRLPKKVTKFRNKLQATKFTKGGFPRIVERKRGKRKEGAGRRRRATFAAKSNESDREKSLTFPPARRCRANSDGSTQAPMIRTASMMARTAPGAHVAPKGKRGVQPTHDGTEDSHEVRQKEHTPPACHLQTENADSGTEPTSPQSPQLETTEMDLHSTYSHSDKLADYAPDDPCSDDATPQPGPAAEPISHSNEQAATEDAEHTGESRTEESRGAVETQGEAGTDHDGIEDSDSGQAAMTTEEAAAATKETEEEAPDTSIECKASVIISDVALNDPEQQTTADDEEEDNYSDDDGYGDEFEDDE